MTREDLFDRPDGPIGNGWTGDTANVAITSGDVGMSRVGGGLLQWGADGFGAFGPDQFSEVEITGVDRELVRGECPFVRRTGLARLQFHYLGGNFAPGDRGVYQLKYDGVQTAQTKILAETQEQMCVPIADVTDDGWRDESFTLVTGGSWWTRIDELTPLDTDYIQAPGNSSALVYECRLSPALNPGRTGRHRLSYRIFKGGSAAATLSMALLQGSTVIDSWTPTLPSANNTAVRAVPTAAAALISDYGDLRLRFTATTGGGTIVRLLWAQMTVPDVAPVAGDVLRIEARGPEISAYVNDALKLGPVVFTGLTGGEIGAVLALSNPGSTVPPGCDRIIRAWRGGDL